VSTAYEPPRTFAVLPPVVKNLLILNGLAYLAQAVFQMRAGGAPFSVVEQWFALWPVGGPYPAVLTGQGVVEVGRFLPWQLVTSAFLHGSFGHILFNMFGLWIFGMRIENTLGSRRFLGFYLACVVGASLLQLLVTSWPFLQGAVAFPTPTLGASGGVLGVLAAFGLLYPDEPIYIYFLFPIPAKWLVLGLAALDLYAGVGGTQSGVANFAHLGGMAIGALLIQYWRGRLPVKPRPHRLA
jgi:membrane associated rhomboid family serine protease